MKRPRLLEDAILISRLPGVKIEMSGDAECHMLYRAFTARHARWRLIQNKRWGVALIEIPPTVDEYLRRASRLARRRIKHATQAGYTFARIDPLARLEEVLEINSSLRERQGRPMHPAYFDKAEVRANFSRSADVFGVVDGDGVLRAYMCVRDCGEVACMERLLGHADALEDGVMYLLVLGVVEWLVETRQKTGEPTWLMYDMFPGAEPGLRHFKHVIGCRPFRVSWVWRE